MPSDTYWGYQDPALLHLHGEARRRYFRLKLWERDGGCCQVCGAPVALEKMDVDHVQPRDQGGPNHWDNLRATHHRCNSIRPYAEEDHRGLVGARVVLAEYPGLTSVTLYRLVQAGRIPAVIDWPAWAQRKRYRFCLDEVRAAFEAMEQERPPF